MAQMASIDAAEREAAEALKAVEMAESHAAQRTSTATTMPLPPRPLYKEPSDLTAWGAEPDIELSLPAFAQPALPKPPSARNGEQDEDEEDDDLKAPPQDVCADGLSHYLRRSLYELLLTSKLNLLLLTTPLAYWGVLTGASDTFVFTTSLLAIAPFAERLSYVTEQLAMHTSQTLGGLLNATFGNVTELIVSLFALRAGLLRIVQVSLLGSILSNLLLVLGTAFLVGGIKYPQQQFNKVASTASFGLLLLCCMCLTFPMVLDVTHEQELPTSSLDVSRAVSVVMLLTYGLYLIFQLKTHAHVFEGDEEDDDEERVLGAWGAIVWLAIITFFISVLSEWMVEAIRGAAEGLGVPDLFLGTIIIPIVGNAAEHAAAIIFAAKNKMELSLGIAVGSATQIALFVIPLCIVIGWVYDVPLSMNLHPFETSTLLITILLVGVLIQTGESHWLSGIVLICAYVVVSIGFFVHIDLPPSAAPAAA